VTCCFWLTNCGPDCRRGETSHQLRPSRQIGFVIHVQVWISVLTRDAAGRTTGVRGYPGVGRYGDLAAFRDRRRERAQLA